MDRQISNGCYFYIKEIDEKEFKYNNGNISYFFDENTEDLFVVIKEKTEDDFVNNLSSFVLQSNEYHSRLLITVEDKDMLNSELFIKYFNKYFNKFKHGKIILFLIKNSCKIIHNFKFSENKNNFEGIILVDPNYEISSNFKNYNLKIIDSENYEKNEYYFCNICKITEKMF